MNAALGSIFTLLLICGAFWIMVRPAFSRARRIEGYGVGRSQSLGRWSHSLVFVVLIPVLSWALAIIGRSYQRSFVVFTEFVSGVHDWPTYRTSVYKYSGMLFAFWPSTWYLSQ